MVNKNMEFRNSAAIIAVAVSNILRGKKTRITDLGYRKNALS